MFGYVSSQWSSHAERFFRENLKSKAYCSSSLCLREFTLMWSRQESPLVMNELTTYIRTCTLKLYTSRIFIFDDASSKVLYWYFVTISNKST